MVRFAQHSCSRPGRCSPCGGKPPSGSSRLSTRGRYWTLARVAASSLAPLRACDRQAIDFWDIARDARIGVAANKIAAQLSEFRRVVGNGADVATVAEFVAKVFASEVLLTNLGSLSFDRQFGPVTLKAMFGPAVLTGFEGHQTIGVATANGALCLLHTSHAPPQGLLEKTQSVLAQACE
jgi:hypothetical protein